MFLKGSVCSELIAAFQKRRHNLFLLSEIFTRHSWDRTLGDTEAFVLVPEKSDPTIRHANACGTWVIGGEEVEDFDAHKMKLVKDFYYERGPNIEEQIFLAIPPDYELSKNLLVRRCFSTLIISSVTHPWQR